MSSIEKIKSHDVYAVDSEKSHGKVEFEEHKGVCQYADADYSNVLFTAHNLSVEEALEIAANDPRVEYFDYHYASGRYAVSEDALASEKLEHLNFNGRNYRREFSKGDVVFFSDASKRWPGVSGSANTYIKQPQ